MKLFSITVRKASTLFKIRIPAKVKAVVVEIHSCVLSIRYLRYYRQYLKTISNDKCLTPCIHLVTLGKDEFYDLFPIYSNLLNQNIPSSVFHTFVSDRYNNVCPSALVINKPFRWLVLQLLERHIHSKYIIFLHLDYFLMSQVDQMRLQEACNILDNDNKIDFIQLACNVGEIHGSSYNQDYNWLDESSSLFFNMQVRIWRHSSLFKLFVNTRYNSISNEVNFSRTCRRLGFRGLIHRFPSPPSETCINNVVFPYMATALNARMWRSSFAGSLTPLLNDYNIDPELRGWNQ